MIWIFSVKNRMLVILLMLLLTVADCQASSATQCLNNYGRNISHFAVLPGFGWDNLRNVEVSRVVEFNYSQCQLTNDGLYFLPNGIDTIPLKQSRLDQSSEIFQTFTEYTSSTAKSINDNSGFHFPGQQISGDYSDSFLKSKNIQIMENSVVVRSQIRYVKYKAKLQPDAILSPAFKLALLSIARHVLYNRTKMARYESEVLVRDFGTHVIISLDAGAALVMEDHLTSEYAKDAKKEDILIGAGASLMEATGLGMGQSSTTNSTTSEYKTNLVHSFVQTYGGSLFMTGNITTWSTNLENHLVAVDREGIPLYNFVNLQTLPSIPSSILYDVTSYIEHAVKSYYVYNSYPGCADTNKTNFNSQTNLDDGSCDVEPAEVYFGGIFQECAVISDEAGDVCSHLKQPRTDSTEFSCPKGFQRKTIFVDHYSKTSSKRVCKTCYALFNCCDDEPISSSADLTSSWCAATSDDPDTKRYYFSGVYSSVLDNVFTQSKSCPLNSQSQLIGDDINICLSDKESTSTVKFGGIFSCTNGNSLASESPNNPDPQACPKGFSARLAGVVKDCAIHYCVPLGLLPNQDTTVTVRRPPFAPKIKLYPSSEGGVNPVYDPEKREWLTDLESRELKESESVVELTAAEAAVIAIFVTIAVLILLGCILYFYRKSQRRYPTTNENGTSNGTVEANL